MDALPQTIQRDYPETYHEMKRNSNHRQFPVLHAAAQGNHSNPMAAMVPEEMNREKQGQQYYNDVHAQRAVGYAPKTDIAREHEDIEKSL